MLHAGLDLSRKKIDNCRGDDGRSFGLIAFTGLIACKPESPPLEPTVASTRRRGAACRQ
jgi:hypothetical protein